MLRPRPAQVFPGHSLDQRSSDVIQIIRVIFPMSVTHSAFEISKAGLLAKLRNVSDLHEIIGVQTGTASSSFIPWGGGVLYIKQ